MSKYKIDTLVKKNPDMVLKLSDYVEQSSRAEGIAYKAAQQQREQARAVVKGFGGNTFAIMNFYVLPGVIHHGDSTELCYGVSNAKSVSIEPKLSEAVWPSLGRCISVSRRKPRPTR